MNRYIGAISIPNTLDILQTSNPNFIHLSWKCLPLYWSRICALYEVSEDNLDITFFWCHNSLRNQTTELVGSVDLTIDIRKVPKATKYCIISIRRWVTPQILSGTTYRARKVQNIVVKGIERLREAHVLKFNVWFVYDKLSRLKSWTHRKHSRVLSDKAQYIYWGYPSTGDLYNKKNLCWSTNLTGPLKQGYYVNRVHNCFSLCCQGLMSNGCLDDTWASNCQALTMVAKTSTQKSHIAGGVIRCQ